MSTPQIDQTSKKNISKNIIITILAIFLLIAIIIIILLTVHNTKYKNFNITKTESLTAEITTSEPSTTKKKKKVSNDEIVTAYYNYIKKYYSENDLYLYDTDKDGKCELLVTSEPEDMSALTITILDYINGCVQVVDKLVCHNYYENKIKLCENKETSEILTCSFSPDSFVGEYAHAEFNTLLYKNNIYSLEYLGEGSIDLEGGFFNQNFKELYSFKGADNEIINMIINNGYKAYERYFDSCILM